jgi:hypothetical protein
MMIGGGMVQHLFDRLNTDHPESLSMNLPLLPDLRWHLGVGDPTWLGWLTVVGYGVAAAVCMLAGRRVVGRERLWWWVVAGLMVGLGVNKQLDVQGLVTEVGRVMARRQGWYRERREVQQWAVFGMLGAAVLFGGLVVCGFWGFWRRNLLLLAGGVVLFGYLAVRAISIHHMDVVLRTRMVGVKTSVVLELTGITLISLAALSAQRRRGAA